MLGLVLALAPTPLSPPTPPAEIELTWTAPEGCPRGEEVLARYEELLTVAPTGEGVMRAEAFIEPEGDGVWRLELVTRMGPFTDVRKLRATRCADLGEATAMLFAVALEPELEPATTPEVETTVQEPDWSEYVDLEPEVETTVVETPPATIDTTPPQPDKRPVFLSTTAGVEAGAVPGVTARLSVGTGYSWDWARVEGDILWYAPRSRAGSFGPAVVQVAGTSLRGCGLPGTGRWKFPFCLGIEAGATIARVGRVEGRRTQSGHWVAPLLRAGAIVQGRRIGGLLALEGAGPVFGTQVRVDDDTIFAPTRGSIRGIAGIEIYFF